MRLRLAEADDWPLAEAGDWHLAEAGDWHLAEAGDWHLAGAGDWQPCSCRYLKIFNVIYGYHTYNKIMYNMDEYHMYNPSPFRFKASLRLAFSQHIFLDNFSSIICTIPRHGLLLRRKT